MSATVEIFEQALREGQRVVCLFDGAYAEFSVHDIAWHNGAVVILARHVNRPAGPPCASDWVEFTPDRVRGARLREAAPALDAARTLRVRPIGLAAAALLAPALDHALTEAFGDLGVALDPDAVPSEPAAAPANRQRRRREAGGGKLAERVTRHSPPPRASPHR